MYQVLLKILDGVLVVSLSLVWFLFIQIVDLHQRRLPQKAQRWYHIRVRRCGGARVVLGGGLQTQRS
jgi:hypothetical protein